MGASEPLLRKISRTCAYVAPLVRTNRCWQSQQSRKLQIQNRADSHKQQSPLQGNGSRRHGLRWQVPGASDARTDLDAVVILAGGQRTDGKLHEWVRRRLEVAADLHRLQRADKQCKLLCCGGGTPHRPPVLTPQGFVLHEATELAQFFEDEGIMKEQMLKEVASYDTIGNGYFATTIHALPAQWQTLGIVTSDFHMPRSRAIFEAMFAAAEVSLKQPGRFALHFYGASDEGIFPEEVLAARLEREAASLAAWRRTAASFTDLATVHHWLHQEHMCYAIPRQDEFGVVSGKEEVGAKAMGTY